MDENKSEKVNVEIFNWPEEEEEKLEVWDGKKERQLPTAILQFTGALCRYCQFRMMALNGIILSHLCTGKKELKAQELGLGYGERIKNLIN